MITATCRTCHQDWTLAQLPSPIVGVFSLTIVLEAPCSHGRLVGHARAFPLILGQLTESDPDPNPDIDYHWEWQDTAYDAAWAAVQAYDRAVPYPRRGPWEPPPLVVACACGATLVLTGYADAEGAEGWGGTCATCGLRYTVRDDEDRLPYAADRMARHQRAGQCWWRCRSRGADWACWAFLALPPGPSGKTTGGEPNGLVTRTGHDGTGRAIRAAGACRL
ncbi:hypothetical protein [Sulfobacillus harzensis]|uniref:Uncharacterized protein n=1 Tax=Sulfobacillus harzensis TaxID=2729629 RepID=A0A7Y0L6H3_9FIRM|nr:hypothetical protein [Sulfobacillus harzensis]NMP23827.1 hypothetical protein [Sulfobacillus harzensis]